MKEYDFKSAKRYIQMHSDLIREVCMGMKEDMWWTATPIYSDSKFEVDLDKSGLKIGGISGSYWATPCMQITFNDGTEVFKDCFTGKSSEQKPEWFTLGCLSQPYQDYIDTKTTPRLADDSQANKDDEQCTKLN